MMLSRRLAVLGSMVYALAIGAAATWGHGTTLVVVCVVGGPIVGLLYWGSSPTAVDRGRDSTPD